MSSIWAQYKPFLLNSLYPDVRNFSVLISVVFDFHHNAWINLVLTLDNLTLVRLSLQVLAGVRGSCHMMSCHGAHTHSHSAQACIIITSTLQFVIKNPVEQLNKNNLNKAGHFKTLLFKERCVSESNPAAECQWVRSLLYDSGAGFKNITVTSCMFTWTFFVCFNSLNIVFTWMPY